MKQVCSHVSNEDKQISSQSLFMQSFFCIFYRNASKCKPQFQLSYHFFKVFLAKLGTMHDLCTMYMSLSV